MNLPALSKFVRELEATENAAHSLWSWLPSSQVAKVFHGDYADEVRPSSEQVMLEACAVFASQKYPNEKNLAAIEEYKNQCPCGESNHVLREKP